MMESMSPTLGTGGPNESQGSNSQLRGPQGRGGRMGMMGRRGQIQIKNTIQLVQKPTRAAAKNLDVKLRQLKK